MLSYPPYCYLVLIRVSSKDYDILSTEANKVVQYLRRSLNESSKVLGPTTASPFKVNNVFRFQIIIKYKFDENIKSAIDFIDKEYAMNRDVFVDIDINPLRI